MGERPTDVVRRREWMQRLLEASALLTWLGLAGLAANLVLSFETPHPEWLWGAGLLACGAPLGMLWHLWMSDDLTAEQKRSWLAGLGRSGAASLFASYFSPEPREAATQRLMDEAAERVRVSRSSRRKA
jgi:hypothetical protein